MKRRKAKTAAELLAELATRPDFVQRQVEKSQRMQGRADEAAALEHPIIVELCNAGFEVAEVGDCAKSFAPLPDMVVTILLDAVARYGGDEAYTRSNVLEVLVRQLGAASKPFDGRALVQCFHQTSSSAVRWAICNTIALSRPSNVDGILHSPQLSSECKNLLARAGILVEE